MNKQVAEYETIGTEFIKIFYQQFDSKELRGNLQMLYDNTSMLTHEGTQLQGREAIMGKLMSLPLENVSRNITCVDFHPGIDGSVLISVMGQLKTGTDDNPIGFTEVFVLKRVAASFVLQSHIFRLHVHNC